MKNSLKWALAVVVALGAVGCSKDDTTSPVNTNSTIEFKQNDQFKYAYYDRDSVTDQRIDSTRMVKQWTVLKTGLTVAARSGVSMIEETTFSDQAGTIPAVKDTFYFQATASGNGDVLQYDALGAVISRFLAAANYADSIPKAWVKVSDTKATIAESWNSLFAGTLDAAVTVTVPSVGEIPVSVKIAMTANHKGTQATTVAAGSYPAAFHTDHQIIVTGTSTDGLIELVRDTLSLSYDVDIKGGILRQVLHSGKFTPQGSLATFVPSKKLLGFELELISVTRAS